MRAVEFAHATGDDGLMSFRTQLPLGRAREYDRAAADGQMACPFEIAGIGTVVRGGPLTLDSGTSVTWQVRSETTGNA